MDLSSNYVVTCNECGHREPLTNERNQKAKMTGAMMCEKCGGSLALGKAPRRPFAKAAAVAFGLLALVITATGCGSSSSSSNSASTTVTGTIFASPVSGASVTVKDASGNTLAGPVTTGADGTYSLAVADADLAGDIIIEATGGTFADEATGDTGVPNGGLSAYVAGGTLSTTASEAHVTPQSTIVKKMVDAGLTFTDAKTKFDTVFGYTPDTTIKPENPLSPAADATDAQLLEGVRAAAFSQLTLDLGLPDPDHQFDILDSFATDIANDGVLDGMDGSTAVLISGHHPMTADMNNKYETAFMNFLSNTNNASGLTADKIGDLPFSKTALTTTYQVEYVAGSMAAMQGKTTFQLVVTKQSDGTAGTGLTVTLTPTMYMSAHSHTTPLDGCTESSTAGTYDCTVYYLMAGGSGMGYWKLQVNLGGAEDAYFYPAVGMSMGGDTVSATLKNSSDTITSMGSTSTRSYKIFKDSLTMMNGMGTLKIFISAMESMTSWPGLYTGLSLNSAAFTATTVVVEASFDSGATWTALTEEATHGHFKLMNIAGLTSGTQATVQVRMTINGNVYSVDPTAATPVEYATMLLTPGSM